MSEMMAQGAYGCIYRPGLKCNGKFDSTKYISKIQKKKERTMNEPILGKMISEKIKFSERHFAPALSVCDADLTRINKQELGKCKVIQNSKSGDEFVNIKVKYVGKYDLGDNMKIHQKKDHSTFLLHLLDSHQYLVEAIAELEKEKIVHHDIKSNNVMYSDSQNVPIIIDFGVSFQLKELHVEENIQDIFFTAYEKYPPWCLEITFIAAIIQEPDWAKRQVDVKTLLELLSEYSENNPIMKTIPTTSKSIIEFKTNWENYIKTFSNDTGKKVVNKLLSQWNTWDVFSIHVMYVDFMKTAGWLHLDHKCTAPYIDYVFSQVLSIPPERDDPTTTIQKIDRLRRNIKKTDFMDFLQKTAL